MKRLDRNFTVVVPGVSRDTVVRKVSRELVVLCCAVRCVVWAIRRLTLLFCLANITRTSHLATQLPSTSLEDKKEELIYMHVMKDAEQVSTTRVASGKRSEPSSERRQRVEKQ